MKRIHFFLVAVLCLFLAAPLSARILKLTLKSGDSVKGDLVNTNPRGMYLLGSGDRSYFYPLTSIDSVVDVKTGKDVTSEFLGSAAAPETPAAPATTVDPVGRSPFDDEEKPEAAPAPVQTQPAVAPQNQSSGVYRPARRTRWIREIPLFEPGFGVDFGISGGSRTPNTQSVQLWMESTPPEAGIFDPPIPASVDFAVMYQPTPKLSFGGFCQWYPAPLGNEIVIDLVDGYYVVNQFDYNLKFGSLAYGGKVRLKLKPKSRAALVLYVGQLSLVDAGFEVIDDLGLLYSEKYTGNAPYVRGDMEFNLLPARRGGLLLGIGYQVARINKIQYKVMGGEFSGDQGDLTSLETGGPIDLDFSGLRVSLTAAMRF